MDIYHIDLYDHLLTRKCSCGGKGEMLIDFADFFTVRCAVCHLSTTHSYETAEEAAAQWNNRKNIDPKPFHIFADNPETYLQGELSAIHIEQTSANSSAHHLFSACIFEYADGRLFYAEHEKDGALTFEEFIDFNRELYRPIVRYQYGKGFCFQKLCRHEDGRFAAVVFRRGLSELCVFANEDGLILSQKL